MAVKSVQRPLKRITSKQLKHYFGEDFVEPAAEEYGVLPSVSIEEVLKTLGSPNKPSDKTTLLKSVQLQVQELKKQLSQIEKQLAHLKK